MNSCFRVSVICMTLLLSACGFGVSVEDTPQNRAELVDRYFELVSLDQMLKGWVSEAASGLPAEQRLDFIEFMTQELRSDLLEVAAKQSFAKHMTVQELLVFIEFMEKPEGKSVMEKMKFYMADVAPVLQGEIIRAIEKHQSHDQNK